MYLPLTARRREFFIYYWYRVVVCCQIFTQGELSEVGRLKQYYCAIVHIVFLIKKSLKPLQFYIARVSALGRASILGITYKKTVTKQWRCFSILYKCRVLFLCIDRKQCQISLTAELFISYNMRFNVLSSVSWMICSC